MKYKEHYVSNGTAIILDEIGFKGECHKFYNPTEDKVEDSASEKSIPIPTMQMALDFIFQEYGIFIYCKPTDIDPNSKVMHSFSAHIVFNYIESLLPVGVFDTVGDALNSAIDHVLMFLIED